MAIEVRSVQTRFNGAVSSRLEAVLEPSNGKAATDELRAALNLVQRYRDAALKALNTTEKHADWTMVDFAVKTDCVVVTVRQGMCG